MNSLYEIISINDQSYENWKQWVNSSACENCTEKIKCTSCFKKRGYALRATYVTSWISNYIYNEDQIIKGNKIMPNLLWKYAETSSKVGLVNYHSQYCNNNLLNCNCEISNFIKNCWPNANNEIKNNKEFFVFSGDHIINRFVNLYYEINGVKLLKINNIV